MKNLDFLKSNISLLDLGSSPGGWSQVASANVTSGKILSIDINNMVPLKNVKFLQHDIFDQILKTKLVIILKRN